MRVDQLFYFPISLVSFSSLSIREFLASEAMHSLGVKTTRALSLVRSETDKVHRPWYSDDAVLKIPDMNDIRLSQYPEDKRREIIQQLRTTQKADPNIMITEPCTYESDICALPPNENRMHILNSFSSQ